MVVGEAKTGVGKYSCSSEEALHIFLRAAAATPRHNIMATFVKHIAVAACLSVLLAPSSCGIHGRRIGYHDQTIRLYTTERTCFWNEICKEEFQIEFRCKCPKWSYCRSPGKYYNAKCSVMASGYIWMQPNFPIRNNWRYMYRN